MRRPALFAFVCLALGCAEQRVPLQPAPPAGPAAAPLPRLAPPETRFVEPAPTAEPECDWRDPNCDTPEAVARRLSDPSFYAGVEDSARDPDALQKWRNERAEQAAAARARSEPPMPAPPPPAAPAQNIVVPVYVTVHAGGSPAGGATAAATSPGSVAGLPPATVRIGPGALVPDSASAVGPGGTEAGPSSIPTLAAREVPVTYNDLAIGAGGGAWSVVALPGGGFGVVVPSNVPGATGTGASIVAQPRFGQTVFPNGLGTAGGLTGIGAGTFLGNTLTPSDTGLPGVVLPGAIATPGGPNAPGPPLPAGVPPPGPAPALTPGFAPATTNLRQF